MSRINTSGGKGSSARPLTVAKEIFESNWDKIFNKNKIDTVKEHLPYKIESCPYIDLFVCDSEKCTSIKKGN